MAWEHVGPAFTREDREILFVFGSARSGTTFLNNLLYRHFGYGMGPEGTFVARYARKLKRYGDLGDDRNLDRLIEDVSTCEMLYIARHKYRRKPYDVTPERIRSNLLEPSYAGVVYSVFESVAEIQSQPRIGNKNPSYWRHFDLLTRLFPTQARYLGIVRDGRDVALSNMKTRWGQSSAYTCAGSWAAMHQALEALRARVGDDRILVIRYEDVLRSPDETLARVRDFLVPSLPLESVTAAADDIKRGQLRTNFDKWKDAMSSRDVRIYEAVAGEWLSAYGYERATENPRVSAAERMWFELKEWTRLVSMNLRARTLGRPDRAA